MISRSTSVRLAAVLAGVGLGLASGSGPHAADAPAPAPAPAPTPAITAIVPGSQPSDVRFSRDGRRLLTVTRVATGDPGVFAVTGRGRRLSRLRPLGAGATSAALSPDATRLAMYAGIGDAGPRVVVESLAGHRPIARSGRLPLSPDEDPQIIWSPRGDRVLVGEGRRSRVLDAHTGRTLGTVPAPASYLDRQLWSPDGRRVAVPTARGILLADPVSHASRTIGSAGDGRSEIAAWSPDGRYVFVQGSSGPVLVDVATSKRIPLRIGASTGHEASWSPDGHRIAYFGRSSAPGRIAVTTVTVGATGVIGVPATVELRAPASYAGYLLRWSRDGTRLAFYAHDQV